MEPLIMQIDPAALQAVEFAENVFLWRVRTQNGCYAVTTEAIQDAIRDPGGSRGRYFAMRDGTFRPVCADVTVEVLRETLRQLNSAE
ncbi:MAG TPA: hypothetical protein VK147_03755 [Candidatus Didemnitutus sp.]|nr:hypothetical protein [Candidatus Didemnitutus sp.]